MIVISSVEMTSTDDIAPADAHDFERKIISLRETRNRRASTLDSVLE